jgi:hypothetical protein
MEYRERKLIEEYWKANWKAKGASIVYEVPMVSRSRLKVQGARRLDALIFFPGLPRKLDWRGVEKKGRSNKKAILVQGKLGRLGMSLMGQTLFSRMLTKKMFWERKWEPKSIHCVALCEREDRLLGSLMRDFGVDVVVRAANGDFRVAN